MILMVRLIERLDYFLALQLSEGEGGASMNIGTTSLADARAYAEKVFAKKPGRPLDQMIPDFDKNYMAVQKAVKSAMGISREKMPVVEPGDTKEFSKRLQSGKIDLFKPYLSGKLIRIKGQQKPMSPGDGNVFLTAGHKDGAKDDDKIPAKIGKTNASKMKPIQKQIWLEKVIGAISKFGIPSASSPVAKTTIITSKDNKIIDGHHRWAQVALAAPSMSMTTLKVPLGIDELLDLARTYGAAIGRGFKA